MKKIERFVIWICSKFTRAEIELIIAGLSDVLINRNSDVKPKDDFKEKHPNYRNFFVDPKPPLKKLEPVLKTHYKQLLKEHIALHGKPLLPVNPKNPENVVNKTCTCNNCYAPSKYLYYNDGKKRSQIKCKICGTLSPVHPSTHRKTKYFCPHCQHALFLWKQGKICSIYKCCNDNCPAYLSALSNLNDKEKQLIRIKSSQFKLHYQFREYHFNKNMLKLSAPLLPDTRLFLNIHNSLRVLSLVLTFHVSLGISARKTAFILRNIFDIPMSYQTVLNYTQTAAYYCHPFNLANKGPVDDIQAGDETYIKIKRQQFYTFFFISSKTRKITAYNVADNRGVLPATSTMLEAVTTTRPEQNVLLVSDGNPSYPAGIHFINQSYDRNLAHKKVIGLQNLDAESEEYRPFKELIERLNRTYKFHTRAACGFKNLNGAVSLTTLFVTHYNFIRAHSSLNYKVPVPLEQLQGIPLLQNKWAKIVQLATSNHLPA